MKTRFLDRLDGKLIERYRERDARHDASFNAERREHEVFWRTWLVHWILVPERGWTLWRAEDGVAAGRSNGVEVGT